MEVVYRKFLPTATCTCIPTYHRTSTVSAIPIPDIPKDILSDILKNDQWAYRDLIKSTTTNEDKIHPSHSKKRRLLYQNKIKNEVKRIYKNWYLIITRGDAEVPAFIIELQKRLRKIATGTNNRSFYDKHGGIFTRFAAVMTRSFRIACEMCRDICKEIRYNLDTNRDLKFQNELSRWIPTWDINNETIIYINLLRSYYLMERVPSTPSTGFTHTASSKPMTAPFDINCLNSWNEQLKKVVCLPYLVSKSCDQVNMNNDLQGNYFYPTLGSIGFT